MDKRKQQKQQRNSAAPKGAGKPGIAFKDKTKKGQGELSEKDLDKVSGGTSSAFRRI